MSARAKEASAPAPSAGAAGGSSSYAQILRSSSIIGGAQGLTLAIGLVRTKAAAMLLDPAGVGLMGLYTSLAAVVTSVTSLGVGSSAVREVSAAIASGNPARTGRTLRALRRTCWASGSLGLAVSVLFAGPLSVWAFGDGGRAPSVAVLGLALLMTSLAAGEVAIVQGARRIGDVAMYQVGSAAVGTLFGILVYWSWRERGIVAVLVVSAAANWAIASGLGRRVPIRPVPITWRETLVESRAFVNLGLAFTWSGLLGTAAALLVQSLVRDALGLEANGHYQAAWTISGAFAAFILGAMATDFFPRLAAGQHDHGLVNRLVEEQTEVGILLALPGLLATLSFGPYLIRLAYSARFVDAGSLLPWLVLGVFARVVSWPLAYVLLAKGASLWYAASETLYTVLYTTLVSFGLRAVGLQGAGIAFAVSYAAYLAGMLAVVRAVTGFRWSPAVARLLGWSGLAVGATFALAQGAAPPVTAVGGGVGTALAGILCTRQVIRRLGPQHRLARLVLAIPVIGWLVRR